MKGNVNPFEPWRPAEANVPPPLHASRPWRPPAPPPARVAVEEPPFAEPADPPRAAPAKPRPRPAQRLAAPSKPAAPLRSDQRMVLLVLFLLGTLGLVGLGWLGGAHFPRVAVALLAVAAGAIASISVARRRNGYVRLGWMAAGLAGAALAAWFVPTVHGVSLWSAYRQMDELHALPLGDVAAFRDGAAMRRTMVEDYPAFAAEVRATEQDWLRRTVEDAVETADRRLTKDPHQALVDLHGLNDELAQLEDYPLVQKDLEAACGRALQACRGN
jgi:hypothetical protein